LIDRLIGFRISAEDETTGVDFTQHAETAYAEAVHGHQPSRRPMTFGDFDAQAPRPQKAEES
ncbi:MAG TPA: ammonia channel protein, partial [Mycobacteriales bacterium]|nr:ammonia channel protein [Mycobacteriales bacterium]